MKTNLKFGMLQTIYTAEEDVVVNSKIILDKDGKEVEQKEQKSIRIPVQCADPKCGRMVVHDAQCFVDTLSEKGNIYCEDCGKCERYTRKKAAQRAENAAKRALDAVKE